MKVQFLGKEMVRHRMSVNSATMSQGIREFDPTPFTATLEFVRYQSGGWRGRRPWVVLKSESETYYCMSIHHFMKIASKMVNGKYKGTFGFTCSGGEAWSIYEIGGKKALSWKVPFDHMSGMSRVEPLAHSIFGHQSVSPHDHLRWLDPSKSVSLFLTFSKIGKTYNTGYSYVVFKDNSERNYYMFMSEFNRVVHKMKNGSLVGQFKFVKRGNYYGIALINE